MGRLTPGPFFVIPEDDILNMMIQYKNVTKIYYPDIIGVKNVNLRIEPGEFISIVGKSGTGKTTLVKLLIAEEKMTSGQINVGGWDITNIRRSEVPCLRRQIGVVFQDFKLLPQKTVFENVAFAMEVCGEPGHRVSTIVPQVLKIVGLSDKDKRYPHQLSGGEAQRVVIARALVHRPKILVADEPTGNLDVMNTKEIVDLLLRINKIGTTVLLVTHNRDVVSSVRRRVITLENGVVVDDHGEGK
jgi:cell division transport system ATP-binding protein